ncbi:MAG: hypothetical protein WCV93_04410 [Candidatus Shapirobacteria bacterium]|jgi:hypothetical protein
MKLSHLTTPALVLASALLLSACNSSVLPQKKITFSDDTAPEAETNTPYVDKFATTPIVISKTYKLNQEFKVAYKTFNPDGQGIAEFKGRSMKEVANVDSRLPEDGKKLVLVEIGVKGKADNKGSPSTFNQVGDTPSPQFVLIDKSKNLSNAEETYYSDAYTVSKKLFELSKITLDHEQWVNTALVFQIDKNQAPDLAFRFINPEGKTEFYDVE